MSKADKMSKLRKFKCNILDWHKPQKQIGFDGASFCSTCRYCGKEILQDSQGNWFKLEDSWLVKKAKQLDNQINNK